MSINESLADSLHQHLYRIFTLFVGKNLQDTLNASQAEFLVDEMLRELRRPTTPKVHDLPDDVTFSEFLNLVQVIFADRDQLQIASDRLFERYVNHVICKGFVLFREMTPSSTKRKLGCFGCRGGGGRRAPTWQYVWCSVYPGMIRLQKGLEATELVVHFDDDTAIEAPTMSDDKSIWTIINGDQENQQVYQFAHLDPIAAQLFVKDMRTSRDYPTREQLADADYKRSYRSGRGGNRKEEELERERTRLESELNEERQNRIDEEIVRGLTSRLLKQEIQKSEQMEQVIHELQTRLGYETVIEKEQEHREPEEVLEEAETEIVLPSREQQIQQYAYHLYTTHADQPITSDDEEVWKQNYNLIVSTQSV